MAEWAQITWDGGLEYRSFYLPRQRKVHILSSVLSDDDISVDVAGLGVLLLDENRQFRGAELRVGDETEREAALTIPVGAIVWKDRFLSAMPTDLKPKWDYDQRSGYCRVEFREGVEDHWLRLGEDAQLWIGADDQQRLTGIAIGGIQVDRDGAAEAAWIEELLGAEK